MGWDGDDEALQKEYHRLFYGADDALGFNRQKHLHSLHVRVNVSCSGLDLFGLFDIIHML